MTYILAILVFGLLIFLHELGHFVVAKLSGIRVIQFTIGFGPAILKKKIGGTVYALRLLPIGGAVMMQGEEDEDSEKILVGESGADLIEDDPDAVGGSFADASLFRRFAVSVAGPLMNFLTGIVIVFLILLPAQYKSVPVMAGFLEGFPYAAADNDGVGFEIGDRIIRVNDFHIFTMADFNTAMMLDRDAHYDITIKRGDEKIHLHNFEMRPTVKEQDSDRMLYGFQLGSEELTFLGKIDYALNNSMTYLQSAVLGLKMLITGQVNTENMIGTVGIASQMSDMAKSSMPSFWAFVAYISINLAFVNLLPIPALDGGKVLFLLIELVRGKKIDPKYEGVASVVGLVLLLGLFVFITYHDIIRIIN